MKVSVKQFNHVPVTYLNSPSYRKAKAARRETLTDYLAVGAIVFVSAFVVTAAVLLVYSK
jgi:hypothetical protein